ncbi:MAG: hypothetical protein AAF960_24080 [Bacteroidota bacterium]
MKYTNLVLLLLCLLACGKDAETPSVNIGEPFRPYFDLFEEEAKRRGVEDIFAETGITIQFGDPSDLQFGNSEFIAGYCDIVSSPPIVNINESIWEILSERNKEIVIFHELGHCAFERQHLNELLPNGELKSMMVGGDFDNEAGNKIINYSGFRRSYYLDELFNEATSAPAWANRTPVYEEITNSAKVLIETLNFEEANNKWLPNSTDCLNGLLENDALAIENTCAELQELTNTIDDFTDSNFELEVALELLKEGRVNLTWGGANNGMQVGIDKTGLIRWQSSEGDFFALIQASDWRTDGKNVINIVRKNNRYFLYTNDTFLYENDFYELAENSIGVEIETENMVKISKLNIYRFD